MMDDVETEPFPSMEDDDMMTDAARSRRHTVSTQVHDENFSERSNERTALLRKMQVILDVDVPVPFWAFCQLADVYTLSNLLRQIAAAPDLTPLAVQSCFVVPRLWAQKPPKFSDKSSISSSSGTSSRSSGRKKSLSKLVEERDGQRCILSKSRPYDVAHIFAYSMLKPKKDKTASDRCVPDIWSVLYMFWSREQVERWRSTIFPDGNAGEDSIVNQLCMRSDLQRAWAEGRFALRPISLSDDKTTLELEFHWMPRYEHSYDAAIPITEHPLSTRNLEEHDACFCFNASGEKIITGSIITLSTSDPDRLPLPSYPLLEMAWHLSRIVSMTASAISSNELFQHESDDDELRGMSLPKRVFDWIPSPNTLSSIASSTKTEESPTTSANQTPQKIIQKTSTTLGTEYGGISTGVTG